MKNLLKSSVSICNNSNARRAVDEIDKENRMEGTYRKRK